MILRKGARRGVVLRLLSAAEEKLGMRNPTEALPNTSNEERSKGVSNHK